MPGGIGMVLKIYRDGGLFERQNVVTVRSISLGGPLASLLVALGAGLQLLGLLIRSKVDLAHIHASSRRSFYRKSVYVLLTRLFRRPVLLHMHGGHFFEFYENECGPLRKAYVRRILRSTRCIVMLSERHRRRMAEIVPSTRLEVLPNASREIAVTPGIREPQHVVFLGRIDPKKGIEDLLRATATLAPRFPALTLTIAGSGDLEWVRDVAREADVADRVETPGWVSGADKDRLLSRAGIFVLPSYFEAQPVSVIEAMAAGLPVVATSVGAVPEMMEDGRQGLLVEAGDVQALTEALGRLCADPALGLRLGEAGTERFRERFGVDSALARLEDLYEQVSGPAGAA